MARRREAWRPVLATALAAALAAGLLPAPALAVSPDAATAGGPPAKVIVTFRAHPGKAAEQAITTAGGHVRFRYTIIPALAASVPAQAIEGLRHNPLVKAVEADGQVTILGDDTPTGDLEYDNAWGVRHIGTKRVHDSGDRGEGVKVAIIDSGIDYVHYDLSGPQPVYPEFNGNYRGGWDFVNTDADPMDDNGHGTHVAGILAADKNGYLVVGVAPRVELYSLKVVDASGNGEYSSVIAALEWAVDHGIDVVNMSIGGHEVSQALADAVDAAYRAHVLMVAAAGNVNPLSWQEVIYGCPVVYPAAYPHVLATTYTNPTDSLTGYSCTGSEVDFAAPGDQVYSPVPVGSCMFCSPYGYQPLSGTSMASPHLAGLVALVLGHGIRDDNGDGLVFDEVKAHLCTTTDPGGRIATTDPRYPKWYGCGVINAGKALVDSPPPTGATNRPPVAAADAATTAEDTPVAVSLLANDSDPDGDALAVTTVTQPAHGTTTINLDGTVTYAPAQDWSGSDSFVYTVSDGHGGTGSATVALTVTPVNDPPVAVNDTATTGQGAALAIPVLDNDTDVDGDTLSVTSVTPPAHGSAVIDAGTTVTYTPAAGYSGSDAFTYTVSDGRGGTATATVSVTVSAINHAPTAVNDTASTDYQTSATIPVLANDSDVDGDALTVTSVGQPGHGGAAINADGKTVAYTPAAGFSGSDSFTYTVSDGRGGSATATVSVTVSAVPATVMHIGDLDGVAAKTSRNWTAQVIGLVVDQFARPVAGVTVNGTWSGGAKGGGTCITTTYGTCTIAKSGIALSKATATFTITSLTKTGATYDRTKNTDPDQDSNGTVITVRRP